MFLKIVYPSESFSGPPAARLVAEVGSELVMDAGLVATDVLPRTEDLVAALAHTGGGC